MDGERRNLLGYWLAILTLTTAVTCADTGMKNESDANVRTMSLPEKAEYHFRELVKSLTELHSAGLEKLPAVLSTLQGGKNLKTDLSDLLLSSILSPCKSIQNSGTGSSTNINVFNHSTFNIGMKVKKRKGGEAESERKPPTATETGGQGNSLPGVRLIPDSHTNTLVRPLNFTIKRNGDMTRITFDVIRSKAATASQTWTYDGQSKSLKGPRDYGINNGTAVVTPVEFALNTSQCPPDISSGNRPRFENFVFIDQDDRRDITFRFPTCFLDVLGGNVRNGDEKEKEYDSAEGVKISGGIPKAKVKYYSEYSQNFEYPDYWQKLNISALRPSPDENTTFDLDIYLSDGDTFHVNGAFFNGTGDTCVVSNLIFISYNLGELNVNSHSWKNQYAMLSSEILSQREVTGPIPGIKETDSNRDGKHIQAKLRITVSANEDVVSGTVFLQHDHKLPLNVSTPLPEETVIIKYARRIDFMSADQSVVIPKEQLCTHTEKRFTCGPHGFSQDQGYGNQCTFFCSVIGKGVKNVRVRKVKGNITPVQKRVEVFKNFAYAFVNLGPTSREQDGEYECRAITYSGKKLKWNIEVRTWGFPKITESKLDVGNDSSTFVCVGEGDMDRKVEISVMLRGEYDSQLEKRIDNTVDVYRTYNQNKNETRMTLILANFLLKWPWTYVVCNVRNDAGVDSWSELISPYTIPSYYSHTDHPSILTDKSSVQSSVDGSTTFKCTATGKPPLTIDFYLDDFNEDSKMSNNSMYTIHEERVDDEFIATLRLPSASVGWPHHTMFCRANNSVGINEHIFSL